VLAGGLEWADPTDLDGLREALELADPERRLAPIGMSRVEIGPEALYLLPEVVAELARGPHVVLLVDATPMRRGGGDLKAEAERLLAERFEVRRAVIGSGRDDLHADEAALGETEAAVSGAGCVVVVGSGTITDVAKEATARTGAPPLVVVQTAASVNAFSDEMAVVLKAGTKRTVPSRWPDALLIDLPVLASAPPAMNRAGFGDLISTWTAPADWYLASAIGMDDSYHEAPVALVREQGRELLRYAAGLRENDPEALDGLARVLTLSGFTLGIAGKTAPLSGTEHLVSHLIDMYAEQSGLPFALHGAQVAVAAVPVAAAWEHRAKLREMVLPPEELGYALREAGAPVRFGDLDPPVAPEIARWALGNCHLMRNRFTLADLLFHVGWWDDAFVERLLDRARSAGGGL
jgi:glycerol-1-phosphate dehydrogenase [NAD(P)+]